MRYLVRITLATSTASATEKMMTTDRTRMMPESSLGSEKKTIGKTTDE